MGVKTGNRCERREGLYQLVLPLVTGAHVARIRTHICRL